MTMRQHSENRALRMVAWHEGGHVVVAHALGRSIGPCTIVPGRGFAGCAWSYPADKSWADAIRDIRDGHALAPVLPPRLRRGCEELILVAVAGEVAECLGFQRLGRQGEPMIERVADLLGNKSTAPRLSARETALLSAAAQKDSDAICSDDVTAAAFASWMNDGDQEAATAHVTWLVAVARRILIRRIDALEAVADALLVHRSLGSEALQQLLAQRGRPRHV